MHFSVDPAVHKNYCHVARYPLVSLYIIVVFFRMLVVCMHPGRPGEYTLLLDLIQVAVLAHAFTIMINAMRVGLRHRGAIALEHSHCHYS